MNPNQTIEKVLKTIKLQIGLDLTLDTHFSGLFTHKGQKYFNVELQQPVSESKEYDLLEKFANKTKLIRVEPNGSKRIAIFFNDSILTSESIITMSEGETIKNIIKRVIKEELYRYK